MSTDAQTANVPFLGRLRGLGVISAVGLGLVGLLLFWVVVNFVKFPADSTQVLLIGITTGAVYALVALGYTLVYGILELINFAHGDVFMLGGMISITLIGSDLFGLHPGQAAYVLWPKILAVLAITMVG